MTFSTLKLVALLVSKVYELKLLSSLSRAVADGHRRFERLRIPKDDLSRNRRSSSNRSEDRGFRTSLPPALGALAGFLNPFGGGDLFGTHEETLTLITPRDEATGWTKVPGT